MARADLLLALVKTGAGADELAFRRAAEALIAEEEAKRHKTLASNFPTPSPLGARLVTRSRHLRDRRPRAYSTNPNRPDV